uniref:Uncharacterized protein n=1 Tax=Panagrolaimus davidi TaxID=227884 RepID=A0A914PMF9_9BILA
MADLILKNLLDRTKFQRSLVAYLSPKNQTILSLFVFDPNNVKNHKRFDITDVEDFVNNLNDFCKKNVRIFILNVFGFNHPAYPHNLVFCQKLIETLSLKFMGFHFVTNEIVTFTSLLIAANITPRLINDVLIITVQENVLNAVELQGFNEFWIVNRKSVSYEEDKYDPKMLCKEILSNVTQLKILLLNMKSTPKRDKMVANLKSELPAKQLVVFENFKWDACKTISELTKSCSTPTSSPYLITPQSCRCFVVGKYNKEKGFCKDDLLMNFDVDIDVPAMGSSDRSCEVSRCHKQFYIGILNSDKETGFMMPPIDAPKEECHRYNLYLEINQNNDPYLETSGIMLEQIEQLPLTLTKTVKTKVPVIEFFDNSSVICIWSEKKKCFEFSKQWNGVYGKDLFLSFEDATPKFTKKFTKKQSFVVYDILTILATPTDEIEVDSDWEFKVIKDANKSSILLEYNTFFGTRSASTPDELMEILLKEHLKVIKDESGLDPTSLGFCISSCYWFSSKEKKILQKKLNEICKNLKVGIEFIKFY